MPDRSQIAIYYTSYKAIVRVTNKALLTLY